MLSFFLLIGKLIGDLCQILILAIFIRAILSWVTINPRNPLMMILLRVTEPVLEPLRRIIPRMGMLDITPLIAIVFLQLIVWLLP